MPRPPLSPRLSPAAPPKTAAGLARAGKEKVRAEEPVEAEIEVLPKPRKRKPAADKENKEPDVEPEGVPQPKKKRKPAADEAEPEEAPKAKKQKAPAGGEPEGKGKDDATPCDGEEPLVSPEQFREKFQITSAREGDGLPPPVQRFEQAPFARKVRKALMAAGFATPMPIQAQCWPIAVNGQDLVAVAKTGSGKTLGFLLPAFRFVSEKIAAAETPAKAAGIAEPMVLVLAPTRELATQIEVECTKFAKHYKVRSEVVYGGAPKGPQVQALKSNPEVVVATPGRLQDLMDMGVVRLSGVQFLVLDEADRMLDMGFEPEIAKICSTTGAERQTLMFTATWQKSVQKIAANYLKHDYAHVNVGRTEVSANTAVSQEFFKLDDDEKEAKLWRILDGLGDDAKLICFTNTKRRVDALAKAFYARGYEVAALHGDKVQREREKDLARFASGQCWLLFATDVCARGLDLQGVTHVVNYDMARDVEGYVHRIGRTGRAGATGASITFWNEAYDMECSPALVKIAKEANQAVPDWLTKAVAKTKEVKNKAWRY